MAKEHAEVEWGGRLVEEGSIEEALRRSDRSVQPSRSNAAEKLSQTVGSEGEGAHMRGTLLLVRSTADGGACPSSGHEEE